MRRTQTPLAGQMQVMAAILLALATATTVVAINATMNYTDNLTGLLPLVTTTHGYTSVEVWANTSVEFENGEAWLYLDNGTAVANQTLGVDYDNGNITVLSGTMLPLEPGNYSVNIIFAGGNFMMPSSGSFDITILNQSNMAAAANETVEPEGGGSVEEPARKINETTVICQNRTYTVMELVSSDGKIELKLKMENGTAVSYQSVALESFTNRTNADGLVCFPFVEVGTCTFEGNDSLCLNPSQLSFNLSGTVDTKPEELETRVKEFSGPLIRRVEMPAAINWQDEFEFVVYVEPQESGVNVSFEIPLEEDYAEGSESVRDGGEEVPVVFRTSTDSCGEFLILLKAETDDEVDFENLNFETSCPKKLAGWMSYDVETDTLLITGDASHCTKDNPCGLEEIYETAKSNGWGNFGRFRNFFMIGSNVVIGNGFREAWVTSNNTHITLKKPIRVSGSGAFVSEDSLIETNISGADQLENASGLFVESGGYLGLFKTSYTVLNPTEENNIYAENGSSIEIDRFTMQRVDDASRSFLYVPEGTKIVDTSFQKNSDFLCSGASDCRKEKLNDTVRESFKLVGGEAT